MGIVTGLAAINKAIEPSHSNNEGPKGRWLQLKDGQSVKIRFLQEIDPDSPHYNKNAGLGIVGIEHTNPKDYKRKAVCTFEDEGQCFGCEQHRRDPKAGWKAKPRFYVNVLVEDGNEDPYVAILSQGTGPKSATPEIGQYAAETGSITNLIWKLKRTGEKTDTHYSIIPLPTAEVKSIDYTKYELYDLEKTAVRNVFYADQENFYMGIVQENSENSSTSSSTEW
jgi:hypothetical protein